MKRRASHGSPLRVCSQQMWGRTGRIRYAIHTLRVRFAMQRPYGALLLWIVLGVIARIFGRTHGIGIIPIRLNIDRHFLDLFKDLIRIGDRHKAIKSTTTLVARSTGRNPNGADSEHVLYRVDIDLKVSNLVVINCLEIDPSKTAPHH